MATLCDTRQQIVLGLKEVEREVSANVDSLDKQILIEKQYIEKLDEYIEKNFPNLEEGDALTEEFSKILKKVFPGNNKIQTAIALKSLLITNNAWTTIAQEQLLYTMPTEYKPKRGIIDIAALPEAKLRVLYYNVRKQAMSDAEGFGKGLYGKFVVRHGTPRAVASQDPTGAYFETSQNTINYTRNVSIAINDFLQSPIQRKSKLNYGWKDIIQEIDNSIDKLLISDYPKMIKGNIKLEPKADLRRRLIRFFIFSMKGDARNQTLIRLHKDGQYYEIASTYRASGFYHDISDEDARLGKVGKEPIFINDGYVPLEEFQGGKFFIDFRAIGKRGIKLQQEIKKQQERFRLLDDELFEYQDKEWNNSVKRIIKGINYTFKLSPQEFNYAIDMIEGKKGFLPKGQDRAAYEDNIRTKLQPNMEIFKMLSEVMSKTAVFTDYWDAPNQKKSNHFPASYHPVRLPDIYKKLTNSLKSKIQDYEILLEQAIESNDEVQQRVLAKEIQTLQNQIKRYDVMSAELRGMTLDVVAGAESSEGELIPSIQIQKYAKRVTNSIPPLNMRATDDAYFHALKSIMGAIERNNMLAGLVFNLGRKGMTPNIAKEMINNYKVPFGFNNIESGMGPFNTSNEAITGKLNKIPFVNVSPRKFDSLTRSLSGYMSAQLLGGVSTALQNVTAVVQNMHDQGVLLTISAIGEYAKKGEDGNAWADLIQRSGVTNFRDLFSKALTNDFIDDSIELDTHKKIMAAVIKYLGYRKFLGIQYQTNNVTNDKAYEEFEKDINKILDESPAYVAKYENPIDVPTAEEAKATIKEIRRKQRRNIVAKFINFSISRETDFVPYIGQNIFTRAFRKGVLPTVDYISQLVAKVPFLTMSTGEQAIRTVSFILGVRKAQEAGILNPGSPKDFLAGGENFHQYDLAIQIGTLFSRGANFGLTPQEAPQSFYSSAGNFIQKFRIWGVQKYASDYNTLKNGLKSTLTKAETDLLTEKDKTTRQRLKQSIIYLKLFARATLQTRLGFARMKNLRKTNPDLARALAFVRLQSILVPFFDLVIFNPFIAPGARFVAMRIKPISPIAGMRSDLMSHLFLLPKVLLMLWLLADDEDKAEKAWANIIYSGFRNSNLGMPVITLAEYAFAMTTGYSIKYGNLKQIDADKRNFDDTIVGQALQLSIPGKPLLDLTLYEGIKQVKAPAELNRYLDLQFFKD